MLVPVSATTILLVIVCLWLLVGILASFVMARRGHDPWSWGVLGALLGPLVVPVALATTRRDTSTATAVQGTHHRGIPGGGPVYVLVGIDGSPDAEAVACTVAELLGERLGRMTLATVVDYDVARAPGPARAIRLAEAQQHLDAAAEAVPGQQPDTVVLTGRPAETLLDYARQHPTELIAIGARGRGVSTSVLGSVAARLVRQRDFPILVAGCDAYPFVEASTADAATRR
jgi:nucleotide-binding universal stress UspA family protein